MAWEHLTEDDRSRLQRLGRYEQKEVQCCACPEQATTRCIHGYWCDTHFECHIVSPECRICPLGCVVVEPPPKREVTIERPTHR